MILTWFPHICFHFLRLNWSPRACVYPLSRAWLLQETAVSDFRCMLPLDLPARRLAPPNSWHLNHGRQPVRAHCNSWCQPALQGLVPAAGGVRQGLLIKQTSSHPIAATEGRREKQQSKSLSTWHLVGKAGVCLSKEDASWRTKSCCRSQ